MEKQNPRAKTEKEANESLDTSKPPAPRNPQGGNSPQRSKQPENAGTPRDHTKQGA